MLDRLAVDVRHACRQIRRAPGFAIAVIATLALTIGANTALFSLFNAIVLRTLPVSDPSRVVLLQASDVKGQNRPIYYRTYRELAALPVFETLTLYSGGGLLQTEARGVRGEGGIEAMTPGFHESLGLRPFLGRFFVAEDLAEEGLGPAVAVISHRFWVRFYGADPNVVGERLLVSGEPMTVVGVTPPEFHGFYVDGGFGFAVPMSFLNRQLGTDPKRPMRGLNGVARLAPGVSLEQARAAVEAAWTSLRVATVPAGLSATETADIATHRIKVESLASGFSSLRTRYREPLTFLMGLTVVLVIIGCINLSGLLLARTAARDQQFALCLALGASRGRFVQQVLVESVLLSLAGTAVALPLAWWASSSLARLIWQSSAPMSLQVTPDARVLTVTALMSLVTGVMVGLLPALRAARNRQLGLRSERTTTQALGAWSRVMLVMQVALSLMLLVGAGLFTSSLANLRNIDMGFESKGARWSRLFAVPGGYRNQNDATYYPELVRQVEALPQIRSASLSSMFPTYFGLANFLQTQVMARSVEAADGPMVDGLMESVTPRFFQAAGIPLRRGRDFTWSDAGESAGVVIVNQALADKLFPGGDAIGQRIRIGAEPRRAALEVVGLVHDASIGDLRTPHLPVAFRPRMQEQARAPVLTFRIEGDPAAADAAVRQVIAGLGHEYPRNFYSLEEQVEIALLQERLLAGMSGFFGGLAMLLAFVGVYGLLAYAVSRRTREIGVRMALGATRGQVLGMVMREGVLLTSMGVAVGIPCALAAGRFTASMLFGLEPDNPPVLAAAALFFVAVGCLAGVWPARRAAGVDPTDALRSE